MSLRPGTEKQSKRFSDQRWILDRIMQALGPSAGQLGRAGSAARLCSANVASDVAQLNNRIQKFNDIPREFVRVARARWQVAIREEEEGHRITARDNYHAACVFYCNAVWGIPEMDNPQRLDCEDKIVETYDGYIRNASYKIERVEIPFEGKSLPALFHIPPNVEPPYPTLLRFHGLDHIKEEVAVHDPWVENGFAMLVPDGPGKGAAQQRKIFTTANNFGPFGKNCLDYLVSRPDVDANRLVLTGQSMGSYWGMQVAAGEERLKAVTLTAPCYEPGMYTIFNSAFPTFRMTFMSIAGITDDDEFDEYHKDMTLEPVAPQVKCPIMVAGGEDDELCHVEYVKYIVSLVAAPKRHDIYEGAPHSVADPYTQSRIVDWTSDRIKGKPMKSQQFFWPLGGGPAIVTDL